MKTLICSAAAVLMDDKNTVLKDAFVAIEDGRIASVGTQRPEGRFDEEIDAAGQVLMPGLVNAHTHVPMVAMRGYGDGHNLQDWLNQYIFPTEARWDDRAIRACTALGLAEMIASGTTCIADMYDHCGVIAQECASAGINANIARGITLFAPEFDFRTNPGCAETRALVEQWHGYNNGQILIDASVHGEYTSRSELWEALAGYAREQGIGMHVHVSETRSEHEDCLKRWGKTPVQILDQYGVWNTRALAAHCVWTAPEDWEIMKRRGVSAVHNPASNLKLGSGIAPVPAMRAAGVNVALGTDGMSSNNSADMFEEMKLAAILHNGAAHDPLAMLPSDALRMATADGGKALGRKTGRIAPGFDADLILVDFSRPNLTPCHDVISHLAYAAHGCDVTMNMARGQVIYKNGAFLTIDLERVRREVYDYALPLLFGADAPASPAR